MTICDDIDHLGGLAATHELLRRGWNAHHLRTAVLSGSIVRVRQGWYANPTTRPVFQRAARVGGTLTCISAARELQLAATNSPTLHVSVSRNAARLRTPDDRTKRLTQNPDSTVTVHWSSDRSPATRYVASVRQILHDMVWCQSPEYVVAAADSALRLGYLTRAEWNQDIAAFPRRLQRLLERVDGKSESIIESLMRFRLEALGISTRSQVRIRGVGHVDLLIGEKLVLELDGWEFHHERDNFEEDRRRDAELARQGYRVLRFTYRQLTTEWARVLDSIRACLARHEHRDAG